MSTYFDELDQVEAALKALGALLAARRQSFACIVAGGAALAAIGTLNRKTGDVDVLGVRDADGRIALAPSPLPSEVLDAAAEVARDLRLAPQWFNSEMAKGFSAGLPPAYESRIMWRRYDALDIGFLGRVDVIALKLEAAADWAPKETRHVQDLIALHATVDELWHAAEWVRKVNVNVELEAKLTWVVQNVTD